MRLQLFILLFVLFVLVVASSSAREKEVVNLYIYHNKPPFVVDLNEKTGLYFDLAHHLSTLSSAYKFETVYLPRKRLDYLIEINEFQGVVLGVSPIWFKDRDESKFLWLPGFYSDRDDFISLKSSPFEYNGRQSLGGKTIASVAGHYYHNINEAVEEGFLLRIDTIGETQVLKLIEIGRADLGIVSQSLFKFLKKQATYKDIFHMSQVPHDSFIRRAFTTLDNQKVYHEMKSLFNDLDSNLEWKNIRSKYE